jgi:NADH dehydrogenase
MRVLVAGGAGFIGRHAVLALLARGHAVVVGSRHPERAANRLPGAARDCERRALRFERLGEPEDWATALEGIDAVVNCVGILRQRAGETYEAVHARAPAALAAACRERGMRLVHVSALGLAHPHRSRFLRSKLAGERALACSGADYRIARPSLLDGPGGYGASWLRTAARLPVLALPARASGRIAVLRVDELGEALVALVEREIARDVDAGEREFDLGGPEAFALAGYLGARRVGAGQRMPAVLPVPAWLARLASHACDLLHLTPFSFGHWELLQVDNFPARNRLAELLGREPRGVIATLLPRVGTRCKLPAG